MSIGDDANRFCRTGRRALCIGIARGALGRQIGDMTCGCAGELVAGDIMAGESLQFICVRLRSRDAGAIEGSHCANVSLRTSGLPARSSGEVPNEHAGHGLGSEGSVLAGTPLDCMIACSSMLARTRSLSCHGCLSDCLDDLQTARSGFAYYAFELWAEAVKRETVQGNNAANGSGGASQSSRWPDR